MNIYYSYVPECQLSDILCLQKWSDKWGNVELPDIKESNPARFLRCPDCLPRCNYVKYDVQSSWGYISSNDRLGFKNFTKSTKYSFLRVFYEEAYVTEYEQTIVYTWDELLSKFNKKRI